MWCFYIKVWIEINEILKNTDRTKRGMALRTPDFSKKLYCFKPERMTESISFLWFWITFPQNPRDWLDWDLRMIRFCPSDARKQLQIGWSRLEDESLPEIFSEGWENTDLDFQFRRPNVVTGHLLGWTRVKKQRTFLWSRFFSDRGLPDDSRQGVFPAVLRRMSQIVTCSQAFFTECMGTIRHRLFLHLARKIRDSTLHWR
jgi:hypothetical protein